MSGFNAEKILHDLIDECYIDKYEEGVKELAFKISSLSKEEVYPKLKLFCDEVLKLRNKGLDEHGEMCDILRNEVISSVIVVISGKNHYPNETLTLT